METTLDRLKKGEGAMVTEMDLPLDLKLRLMELGLLEGREVRLVRFAPLGDPVEILVMNSRIAIRRTDASGIRVRRHG